MKWETPISYQVYGGNTYEGKTMIDALGQLKKKYSIDQVIVVADSAMIDQNNQDFINQTDGLDYIIGDRIKNLPKKITEILLDKTKHKAIGESQNNNSVTMNCLIKEGELFARIHKNEPPKMRQNVKN